MALFLALRGFVFWFCEYQKRPSRSVKKITLKTFAKEYIFLQSCWLTTCKVTNLSLRRGCFHGNFSKISRLAFLWHTYIRLFLGWKYMAFYVVNVKKAVWNCKCFYIYQVLTKNSFFSLLLTSFPEEILNGKLNFLCNDTYNGFYWPCLFSEYVFV